MLEERVSALEVEAAVSRNHAFVFIKPHAVTPAVAELLKTRLGEHGISISAEGVLDNETIDKDKLIDKHYGAIASKAVRATGQPVCRYGMMLKVMRVWWACPQASGGCLHCTLANCNMNRYCHTPQSTERSL